MEEADKKIHVALACGGTGGHIFPGLATAEVLHQRGHKVTLWLAGKDIEAKAVAHTPWQKITIPSKGWEGGWRKAHIFIWNYFSASRRAKRPMRKEEPDVVLAMGSYAGMGPVRAAMQLGIPVVLHEANSVPGRMVSYFAKNAARVGATFEMTRHELKGKARLHLTGMPLREDLAKAAVNKVENTEKNRPFYILCMGGSRGASALNLIARRAIRDLFIKEVNIFVIHFTGQADEESVRTCYENAGIPHYVAAFEPNMTPWYEKADLAICRSGASTCAELSAFGIPALLVPYPYAARNHQYTNASEFFRIKAADLIEERDLEVEWLTDYLEGCIYTPERLHRMRNAMRAWAKVDAADQLADLVEEAARNG
ncbi:UDP-N-acetylglucosamine--N-acetylmuramyl-(pentapeptide) pyrophosphoryl-undecaprenol N-acetylglucosamine transferase [Kiritimatiellaeota bacterium B1221]|nr:UDP-N-acetylglucosamine--N-acetylmuramyl-(pentapeptide) pyrophosphoryl-undecaprenol N-acetylglucosamine transferase [Kiritimatiellaeota bacterium B1221]